MTKPLKYGFCSIWNEEKCIRGWAKQLLALCEHVTAIVDPNTTDHTVNILKSEFPEVEILWQDRTLGDTDYTQIQKLQILRSQLQILKKNRIELIFFS